MINRQLLDPKSMVIVGGSNDITKPGGKILKNIRDGGYKGALYVLNPKENAVQGIKSSSSPEELPEVELAIIAIAARHVPAMVESLIHVNLTRAFIIISAGFSEESEQGSQWEKEVVRLVNDVDGALIGPNCIGILTPSYHGVFTLPIPKLDMGGCDFISGSGATACFIMENGIPKGLAFARVFSVGNSAQMGVEDILQYMDETFDPAMSPRVKLLYLESINNPTKLLKHASSLIHKGCRIAAIKAGTSEAGSRAASSHTGALSSSDMAVNTLFKKAGIIRCYGRDDLINVAAVLMHKALPGKNLGIISHAGGPAVMMTDALSGEGFNIPKITSPEATELLEKLFPGSSVANPIDFLATGTAEQLGEILDYCDNRFNELDALAVIFGTPGLTGISEVYKVLHDKIVKAKKPIFAILPSTLTAREEINEFIHMGHVYFPDEVLFAQALSRVYNTPSPKKIASQIDTINSSLIREVIEKSDPGYLPPEAVATLLDAASIYRVPEAIANSSRDAVNKSHLLGLPVVMKVIGPVHKSDVGGVALNINTDEDIESAFLRLMDIEGATGVLIQPMITGHELFVGATHEEKFGHLVFCGMGGVMIEVLKDFNSGLSPINREMALEMIQTLKSYPILKGFRGKEGIDIEQFAITVEKVSALLETAPEIREMDINPLIGSSKGLYAVDTRIRIEK